MNKTIEASRATSSDLDVPAPSGCSYRGYQRAGVEFTHERYMDMSEGVLIADEMGVGKTIQAIGVINADPTLNRVLVICPASVKINWQRELTKWLTRPLDIGVATGKSFPATHVVIINYDILHKHHKALRRGEWDILIRDEADYCCNIKSKRTKESMSIPTKLKLDLTGTPFDLIKKLWPLLHHLQPNKWGSYEQFADRFCGRFLQRVCTGKDKAGKPRFKQVWNDSGASNTKLLSDLLRSRVMIRRVKKDVLKELPPKVRQLIELPQTGSKHAIKRESQKWEEVCRKYGYDAAVDSLKKGTGPAFQDMAKERHDVALAKIPACLEFIKDALKDGRKIVVFAHHRDVLQSLFEGLKEYNPAILIGGMSEKAKQEQIDKFQGDESCKLFLGNLVAAGIGITLTAAWHEIFVEFDWRAKIMAQAEDRCHRIGATGDSVLIQHLVLADSLDAHMAQKVLYKSKIFNEVLE